MEDFTQKVSPPVCPGRQSAPEHGAVGASRGADLYTTLHHAAFAARPDRAFLRVTGADATRWLNGMVTNNVAELAPGQGNYNFLLNAQGRIQGDSLIFRDPSAAQDPEFLLATDAAQIDALQQHLERFIIMDDVELTPAFEDEITLELLGRDTPQHLASLGLPALDPLRLAHADTPHGPVLLFTPLRGTVPRVELRAPTAIIASLHGVLTGGDVPEASADTLEQFRVFESIPRFGTDIRYRELPQETSQVHALHFAKGCYLGQEIVERIRSRGQVHRVFTAFRLEGSLPGLPVLLEADGKPLGELTSAAQVLLPEGPALLALGYARREALDTGKELPYPGGVAYPLPLRARP